MRPLLLLALIPLQAETFIQVSAADPRYLETAGGKGFVPIGLNIGWERFAQAEEEVFRLTENRFRLLAENGGNFARIFLGHPFYQLDPVTPGVIDPRQVERIQRLVALARKHGIRLKLCLEHFRTMKADPPRFPGSISMGAPHYGQRYADMTEYFRHGREVFLAKLDALAARFANEPTIYGWELWNEINASREPGWEEWTREMLPELKKRFPRHLAMQSLGSFDSEAKSAFYERFSRMPGNELAQVHRYLDEGAPLKVCHGPMDLLAADSITRLLSFRPQRPVLISEVGAVEPHHAGPFRLYAKDVEGVLLHDGLFAPFFSGAAGPGQFWHWQDYVEPNRLWWHFGRFAEAIRGIDPPSEAFQPARNDQPGVRVYVLKGKKTNLLWVRDAASDWRTELAEGRPPAELRGVKVPFPGEWARVYDPWKAKWHKVRTKDGSVVLPAFRRSVVVR